MNIIAFEGINNIGKTTFIAKLIREIILNKKQYNISLQHFTGFINFKQEFKIIKQHIKKMNNIKDNEIQIYDRLSFTAAPFFGKLYRNYTDNEINKILLYVKNTLSNETKLKLHIYICKNSNKDLFDFTDEYLKLEDREKEIDFYYNKLPEIFNFLSLQYNFIDVNDDTIINNILKLINYI